MMTDTITDVFDKTDTITCVFDKKGQHFSKQDTFNKLVERYSEDRYKKKKAAGSMGGAVAHEYIKRRADGDYECMRDPKAIKKHEQK